jgi:hypothetical protein
MSPPSSTLLRVTQFFYTIWAFVVHTVLFLAVFSEPRRPEPELPLSNSAHSMKDASASMKTIPSSKHLDADIASRTHEGMACLACQIPRKADTSAAVSRYRVLRGPPKDLTVFPRNDPERNEKHGIMDSVRNKMKHADLRVVHSEAMYVKTDGPDYVSAGNNVLNSCPSPSPEYSEYSTRSLSIGALSDRPSFSPTPSADGESSVYSTPCTSPPLTPIPLPSTFYPPPLIIMSDDDDNDDDEQAPSSPAIGALGRRRGFKGAPLFTPSTAKKSTFLAIPSAFSPRTPRTLSPVLWPPTPKSADSRHQTGYKQISLDLQEDYDAADPFGPSESYYTPSVVFNVLPGVNLYNFMPYNDAPPQRTPSLKRKRACEDLHPPSSTQTKFNSPGLTNVYDASVYNCPERGKAKNKDKTCMHEGSAEKEQTFICDQPDMILTLANPPKSDHFPVPGPTQDGPAPTATDSHSHSESTVENMAPGEPPSTRLSKTPHIVGPIVPELGHKDAKSSGLRPLVLPLRVARRNASLSTSDCVPALTLTSDPHFTAPSQVSVTELTESSAAGLGLAGAPTTAAARSASICRGNRRSKALDDIIALLDAACFDFAAPVEVGGVRYGYAM